MLHMTKGYDIVGYTFNGSVYCPDDMKAIAVSAVNLADPSSFTSERGEDQVPDITTEFVLSIWAEEKGINHLREDSYDSGDFPKVVFATQVEDGERCGACGEEL